MLLHSLACSQPRRKMLHGVRDVLGANYLKEVVSTFLDLSELCMYMCVCMCLYVCKHVYMYVYVSLYYVIFI